MFLKLDPSKSPFPMETLNPVPPLERGVRGDLGLNKSQEIIENCYISGQKGTGIQDQQLES